MSTWYRLLSRKVGLPAIVIAQVRCDRRVRIPLADGVRTLADHWTPVGVDRAPLILVRSPYGRRLFNHLVGRYFAHQGFQVLIQSSRGTDGSEGTFDDPFACEVEDGAATVRWLVEQPFYPGRFFTFGDSYLGYAQLALAEAAGNHLAGAVLRVAPSSVYGMVWPGGSLFFGAVLAWSLMAQTDPRLRLTNVVRDKRVAPKIHAAGRSGTLLTSYRSLARGPIGFWEEWLQHPAEDDPFWERLDVSAALDTITCPVLVQGGWYDLFLEDSIGQYTRLAARGVPAELQLGPWTHAHMLTKGLVPSLTDATAFLRDVSGLDAQSPKRQPVRLVEISSKAELAYGEWPPAPEGELTYHLAPGGRLTSQPSHEGATRFRYDPANPTPSVGGASNDAASGSKDNSELEERADVVTFTSEPLVAETHLLGAPSVALRFESDRPDTAVFLRLCEVTAAGQSRNHTDRLVLLRAADREANGTWWVNVPLPPTCLRLPAGHRVRLQVSSGAYPRFARHPGTDEAPAVAVAYHPASQVVHHAGATLRLPVRSAHPDSTARGNLKEVDITHRRQDRRSATPMAQPMRALLGAVNAMGKLGLGPPMESVLAKPHAERIAHLNPGVMTRKVTALIDTQNVHVPGRGGPIHVRTYKRPDTAPGAPGYLFIHGGGFALGGVEFCDHVCRELADRSGFVVVGLSYRLAPQHPFPAGIEDCQDVLTWMAKEAPCGLDPDRLAVAGESAGGNFTALLALWARDNNGPRIAHQAPIYPLTDFTASLIDWREGNAGNPGVTPEVWAAVGDVYCGDTSRADPLMSPVFADHKELPPALVVTCEHDILRHEGVALADSYREAGVDVTHVHLPDMPHGHLLMTRLTKRSYETMDLMISQAKRYL